MEPITFTITQVKRYGRKDLVIMDELRAKQFFDLTRRQSLNRFDFDTLEAWGIKLEADPAHFFEGIKEYPVSARKYLESSPVPYCPVGTTRNGVRI